MLAALCCPPCAGLSTWDGRRVVLLLLRPPLSFAAPLGNPPALSMHLQWLVAVGISAALVCSPAARGLPPGCTSTHAPGTRQHAPVHCSGSWRHGSCAVADFWVALSPGHRAVGCCLRFARAPPAKEATMPFPSRQHAQAGCRPHLLCGMGASEAPANCCPRSQQINTEANQSDSLPCSFSPCPALPRPRPRPCRCHALSRHPLHLHIYMHSPACTHEQLLLPVCPPMCFVRFVADY